MTTATYLDRVVYRFFDGAKDAMIAAFLSGEIDVATDLLQGDYAAISSPPEGFEARILPAWETEHFDFNQSGRGPGQGHPALTDPNVRPRWPSAIDKAGLYAAVYPGIPAPERSPAASPRPASTSVRMRASPASSTTRPRPSSCSTHRAGSTPTVMASGTRTASS